MLHFYPDRLKFYKVKPYIPPKVLNSNASLLCEIARLMLTFFLFFLSCLGVICHWLFNNKGPRFELLGNSEAGIGKF